MGNTAIALETRVLRVELMSLHIVYIEMPGLATDGKPLLLTNMDMEPCAVDPQLRMVLQWLVVSEADVAELSFHDSAKKEFIPVSTCLRGVCEDTAINVHDVLCHTLDPMRSPFVAEWASSRVAECQPGSDTSPAALEQCELGSPAHVGPLDVSVELHCRGL